MLSKAQVFFFGLLGAVLLRVWAMVMTGALLYAADELADVEKEIKMNQGNENKNLFIWQSRKRVAWPQATAAPVGLPGKRLFGHESLSGFVRVYPTPSHIPSPFQHAWG